MILKSNILYIIGKVIYTYFIIPKVIYIHTHTHTHTHIYIYIYIDNKGDARAQERITKVRIILIKRLGMVTHKCKDKKCMKHDIFTITNIRNLRDLRSGKYILIPRGCHQGA